MKRRVRDRMFRDKVIGATHDNIHSTTFERAGGRVASSPSTVAALWAAEVDKRV